MDTKIEKTPTKISKDRKDERGAALVTVMMLSFLMLVASIALILEASMSTVNFTDATSEEQAYYAAESGIQSVINALRHNAKPSPSVDPAATPLPSGEPAVINRLDYRKAVDSQFSNASCSPLDTADPPCGDSRDNGAARLSRWLDYNWSPENGTGGANPDRVVLGDPEAYSPMNGFAYSVEVSNPDNPVGTVTFTVDLNKTGIDDGTGTYGLSRRFPDGGLNPDENRFTDVEFIPNPVLPPLDISSGSGIANIGSFRYTNGENGPGVIPVGNEMARFKITLRFSQPANTFIVIRGYILSPDLTDLRNGADPGSPCQTPSLSFLFDSQNFLNFGSRQTIVNEETNPGCLVREIPTTHNGPYGTYLTGWQVQPAAAGTNRDIRLEITQPEPTRMMIRSTGYGPRGARKQLEAIIQKNYFDGMGAPSPLTLIGPTCTRIIGATDPTCNDRPGVPDTHLGIASDSGEYDDFMFEIGTANPMEYSGFDEALTLFQPPMGVTNNENLAVVRNAIAGFNGKVFGTPENIADELPYWLQNPANLEATIDLLREVAQASGSYYGLTTTPPNNAVYGDWATGTGITVIDSSAGARLNQKSGGLLVVTRGRLELNGRYDFKGVMVVTGPGGLYRAGGGGGQCDQGECGRLQGNLIIAPYNDWSLNTCMPNTANNPQYNNKLNCFFSPKYEINGGGNSDIINNQQHIGNALNGLGNFVKGVAEK